MLQYGQIDDEYFETIEFTKEKKMSFDWPTKESYGFYIFSGIQLELAE